MITKDTIIGDVIKENENALHIEQFLRRQGYSRQKLTELKKMPESILVNGHWSRL